MRFSPFAPESLVLAQVQRGIVHCAADCSMSAAAVESALIHLCRHQELTDRRVRPQLEVDLTPARGSEEKSERLSAVFENCTVEAHSAAMPISCPQPRLFAAAHYFRCTHGARARRNVYSLIAYAVVLAHCAQILCVLLFFHYAGHLMFDFFHAKEREHVGKRKWSVNRNGYKQAHIQFPISMPFMIEGTGTPVH